METNLERVRERLSAIPGVRLIEPEATFLLWFDFRELFSDPVELTDFLVDEGIAETPSERIRS